MMLLLLLSPCFRLGRLQEERLWDSHKRAVAVAVQAQVVVVAVHSLGTSGIHRVLVVVAVVVVPAVGPEADSPVGDKDMRPAAVGRRDSRDRKDSREGRKRLQVPRVGSHSHIGGSKAVVGNLVVRHPDPP